MQCPRRLRHYPHSWIQYYPGVPVPSILRIWRQFRFCWGLNQDISNVIEGPWR